MFNIVSPESVGFSSTRLQQIGPYMQSYVDQGKVAGIMTLLARKDSVVHFECFGQRNLEDAQPMMSDTIFRIYSMTKPITNVAAMMLYEEGRFFLDDPLTDYLPKFQDVRVYGEPEWTTPQRPITIRDLMLHTAGFTYGFFDDSPVEKRYQNAELLASNSPEEFIQRLSQLPLVSSPGEKWRYSVATDVLGHLVSVISGRSLAEFFAQYIFEPLGMADTDFYVDAGKLDRFASMYEAANDGSLILVDSSREDRYTKRREIFSGGGGLTSTISDYLRFAQMLLNGGELNGTRILGRKTIELMTKNHLPQRMFPIGIGDGVMSGYGFGLGFSVVTDMAAYGVPLSEGSYGWSGLANTNFWVDPVEEVIGIFMTQLLPSNHYPLTRQFKILSYQALV